MNDVKLATKFIQKNNNAMNRSIPFELTFTAYKNLMRAKRCFYTGVELTNPVDSGKLRPSDRTIDRKNSKLGYVKGNVCACCHAANDFKAVLERNGLIGIKEAKKMIKVMEKK